MKTTDMAAIFEQHDEEFLKFDRIPVEQRRHHRPDICGMIYLDECFPGDRDMISAAEHDVIYFEPAFDEEVSLTKEDVVYLLRCGFGWSDDLDCLYSWV